MAISLGNEYLTRLVRDQRVPLRDLSSSSCNLIDDLDEDNNDSNKDDSVSSSDGQEREDGAVPRSGGVEPRSTSDGVDTVPVQRRRAGAKRSLSLTGLLHPDKLVSRRSRRTPAPQLEFTQHDRHAGYVFPTKTLEDMRKRHSQVFGGDEETPKLPLLQKSVQSTGHGGLSNKILSSLINVKRPVINNTRGSIMTEGIQGPSIYRNYQASDVSEYIQDGENYTSSSLEDVIPIQRSTDPHQSKWNPSGVLDATNWQPSRTDTKAGFPRKEICSVKLDARTSEEFPLQETDAFLVPNTVSSLNSQFVTDADAGVTTQTFVCSEPYIGSINGRIENADYADDHRLFVVPDIVNSRTQIKNKHRVHFQPAIENVYYENEIGNNRESCPNSNNSYDKALDIFQADFRADSSGGRSISPDIFQFQSSCVNKKFTNKGVEHIVKCPDFKVLNTNNSSALHQFSSTSSSDFSDCCDYSEDGKHEISQPAHNYCEHKFNCSGTGVSNINKDMSHIHNYSNSLNFYSSRADNTQKNNICNQNHSCHFEETHKNLHSRAVFHGTQEMNSQIHNFSLHKHSLHNHSLSSASTLKILFPDDPPKQLFPDDASVQVQAHCNYECAAINCRPYCSDERGCLLKAKFDNGSKCNNFASIRSFSSDNSHESDVQSNCNSRCQEYASKVPFETYAKGGNNRFIFKHVPTTNSVNSCSVAMNTESGYAPDYSRGFQDAGLYNTQTVLGRAPISAGSERGHTKISAAHVRTPHMSLTRSDDSWRLGHNLQVQVSTLEGQVLVTSPRSRAMEEQLLAPPSRWGESLASLLPQAEQVDLRREASVISMVEDLFT